MDSITKGALTGCSKRPSSKAAEVPLRYVEPLSEARTKLWDFFNSLLGFCFDTFNIQTNLDLVADDEPTTIHCPVPDHTEVFTVELSLCTEAGPVVAPGIFRRPIIATIQSDILRHPMQRKVSHSGKTSRGFLIALHLVGNRRILFHIQKFGTPQVGIPFDMIRIYRLGHNRSLDRRYRAIFGIHVDKTGIVHESACGFGNDHVRNAKFDGRMFRVQVPTSWLRLNRGGEPPHGPKPQKHAPHPSSPLHHE